MIYRLLTAVCALFAAIASPLPVLAQDDLVPLSAYGELPGVQDATISPLGTRMALVSRVDDEPVIIIVDQQAKLLKAIPLGDLKFRSLTFVDEETLLLRRSETVNVWGFVADKYEISQMIVLSVEEGRDARVVFSRSREVVNAVFGTHGLRRTGDGWRGYFGALRLGRDGKFEHGRPYLYEYNFSNGQHRRVSNSATEDQYRDWIIASHGGVAAEFDISRNTGKWQIRNGKNQLIAEGVNPTGRAGLIGLGADGSTLIYYRANTETGVSDWFEVPLAGGESVPFLPDVEVERSFRNPENGHLLGYLTEDRPVLFDETLQKNVSMVLAAFKDANPVIWDHDAAFNTVIVHTQGNGDSGTWYRVDVRGRRAEPIGYDRPLIPPERVANISTVEYTAADGLEMDGILTLPLGREASNLPLVVLPHGGPSSHDTDGFDWWAQAFASRGYAVFQPNFRGSTGRGEEFRRLGYGEWGGKMQSDISDGVAFLAEQGTIDPSRACIVGASYGGYAALAGVTLQRGLYRCAVSVNGVADISLMFRTENRESADSRMQERSLREQLGDSANWKAISPRDNAARADAPILLIHGRDDTVVAFEQSYKMADALDDAGKPHQLIELNGEDHWLSLPETRKRMLEETMAFVQQHNPAN